MLCSANDANETIQNATRSGASDGGAILDAARRYASRGWRVLPLFEPVDEGCSCRCTDCRAAGKHPRTRRGSRDATADLELLARWWARAPLANVGIATGHGTDLLVLDIDPRSGGTETLEELEWRLGTLPQTVESLTGGRGTHLFFRAPDVNRPRGRLGPGVDVKFDGGYVVAPPSRHSSGRAYAWARGRSPEELAPAALPFAWREALVHRPCAAPIDADHAEVSTSERELRARRYIRRVPPAVSGEHGHDTTFRAAVLVVRGFDLDVEVAYRVLRDEWNNSCEPPWSEKDLRRKVEQAAECSTAARGFLLGRRER